MLSDTKHSLCLLLEKLHTSLSNFSTDNEPREKTFVRSNTSRAAHLQKVVDNSELIFSIVTQFEILLEYANQLCFIEPTAVNQIVLIGITRQFVHFFNSQIVKVNSVKVFHTWTGERAKFGVNLKFNHITRSLIHGRRRLYHEIFQRMITKSTETAFRKVIKPTVPKLKQMFSEFSIEEKKKDRPLTFEEAVLIIQKMERFYKAARRKSIDLHRSKVKRSVLTKENAAVVIQSKVRGYLARKKVRQVRKAELDLFGLSIESVLNSKLNEEREDFLNTESYCLGPMKEQTIEHLLDLLKSNASCEEDESESYIPVTERAKVEKIYYFLLQRGIMKKPENVKKTCNLVSYVSPVKYKNYIFEFDVMKFLEPVLIYPLMLSSWHISQKSRWTLLIGTEKSGKSRWVEEIALRASATYLYVTARTVMIAPKALIQWITKLHQIDKTVVVAIDRLEQFPKQKTKDTSTKMLFRNFLNQLRQTNVFVVGMSRTPDFDTVIRNLFEAEINISYPDFCATYDLCTDLLSTGWRDNQLRKLPTTLWDVLVSTTAMNCGEVISNVRNNWFQS